MMSRKNAFRILFVLYVASIVIRLPNLNRPVSKHHEFNTAVVLINIESWRQAGGGAVFHYTPLMNFQHPGDRHFDTGPHIDRLGNHLYLSYGPGWYLLPYFVYQLFQLPANPLYLQVINLLINLLSLVLLFYFFERLVPVALPKRYWIVLAGCAGFLFTPAILWYLGNGYVNIGIMMPLVITILLVLLPMIQDARMINTKNLIRLFLLLVALCYFDWFGFFLSAAAGLLIITRIRKEKKYLWLCFVLAGANLIGIGLVFLQFASYAGTAMVIHYWTLRFGERSMNGNETSLLGMIRLVIQHILTSYLPFNLIARAGSYGLEPDKENRNNK